VAEESQFELSGDLNWRVVEQGFTPTAVRGFSR
jgi:hypothetical protein